MSLRVLGEEFASSIEVGVFADTGENVDNFAAVRFRVLDAVSGDEPERKLMRKIDQLPVSLLFAANEMTLQFYENIFAAERVDQKLEAIRGILGSARFQRADCGILPQFSARQDAELCTQDGCAPRTSARFKAGANQCHQTLREFG